MPTNFGTGFGPTFGNTGWNNQQLNTKPTKQQKFPGLSDDQIKRLESLTSNPQEQQKLYQQAIQQMNNQNYTDNRFAAENELSFKSMQQTDPKQKNYMQSNLRLEQLADLVKDKYKLNSSAKTGEVINGLMGLAQSQGISINAMNKYLESGDETFLYQMGLKDIAQDSQALGIKAAVAGNEGDGRRFGRLDTEEFDKDAGVAENADRFLTNVVKSGVNVLSDVGNMIIHPLDTANSLAKTAVGGVANLFGVDDSVSQWGDWFNSANETADQVGQFFKERYYGDEGEGFDYKNVLNTLFTDPVGVVSDVATLISGGAGAVRGVARAGAKGAAKAGMKGTARALERAAEKSAKIAKAGLEYDPYSVAMKLEMKPISATIDYAKKLPGAKQALQTKLTEAMDKAYGLDELTKKDIQNNPFSAEVWQKAKTYIDANGLPEKSTEVAKTMITDVADRVQETMKKQMEELGETGPMYKTLKDAGYSVDLSELKAGIDDMLTDYGIKIEDGKLDFSKTAIDGGEASNIIKIYNWLQSTDKPMSMSEYLDRFRRTISDMVDYNPANRDQLGRKLADTQGDKVLKGIREGANKLAHEQVTPLKDLDALFKKQVDLIDEVTEGIVYKDSKKKGVVRDNINQIMKNLDEPNRRVLKYRLEKVLPGIEEEVKAINMLPKLIDHYYKPSKLQQNLTTWGGGAMGGLVGGTPGAILGAGAGYLLSNWIDKLKSERWNKIISETSEEGVNKLADIQKRISENQKITQDQKAFLEEISDKLKEGQAVKEGEIARIISEVASATEDNAMAVLDKAISDLETIGAKEQIKDIKGLKEEVGRQLQEQTEMAEYERNFNEVEKQQIINESADQRLPEFKKRIYQLGQEERRIGSVAGKKIGKSFEGKDFKNTQQTERLRKKDRIIEEIGEYYNVDQYEASNIYDRIERTASVNDLESNSKSQAVKSDLTIEEPRNTESSIPEISKEFTREEMDNFKWKATNKQTVEEVISDFQKAVKEYEKKGGKFTLNNLLKNTPKYKQAKVQYDKFLKNMAEEVGGTAITAPLKIMGLDGVFNGNGIKRALEKANKAKNINGIDDVTDIVRGTVTVSDQDGINRVIEWAKKNGVDLDDKFREPTKLGYKDLSFIHTTENGIRAEVQINIPEIIVAKEGKGAIEMKAISEANYEKLLKEVGEEGGKGHKYYEEYRDLETGIQEGTLRGEEAAKAEERMQEIQKESQEYYKKFEDHARKE